MKRLMLIPALLLSACVMQTPPVPDAPPARDAKSAKPIVIMSDKGGNVMAAIRRREQLARSGREVQVRGYCRSACTIYITLPNACLGPGATVGFHAPRLPGTHVVPPIVDQMMAQYYRGGIRRKWDESWRHSLDMTQITAQEYVRLDPQTRLCN